GACITRLIGFADDRLGFQRRSGWGRSAIAEDTRFSQPFVHRLIVTSLGRAGFDRCVDPCDRRRLGLYVLVQLRFYLPAIGENRRSLSFVRCFGKYLTSYS